MMHGGLIQFIAGIWELYRKNVFGATAFTAYGGFWMGFALMEILAAGGKFSGPDPGGLQTYFAAWGIFTTLMFVPTLAINRALQFIFASLALLFFLLSAGVTYPQVHKAAGYVGIVCGFSAVFTAWAEVMNEVHGRTVIPLGVVAKSKTI
mmetsp:Transcript_5960/g.9314  ORF Transcript_5960/g.9314 Transcript_5960/m.9314 type:complete len:150 (+) Transcript_5960:1977-2426(+)